MKKLLTIAFFSVFCLGAKTLGAEPTKINLLRAHHMDVTLRVSGKKFYFENECIQFKAWNGSNGWGYIRLLIDVDDSPESYEKLERAMSLLKSKIPALVLYQDKDTDKNGIHHASRKTGATWDGYQGWFSFRFENIWQIDLY